MLERRDTGEPMHVHMYMYVFVSAQLVAAATIREQRLFRSALAQVRLLFESGVYSREASIWSYTVISGQLPSNMHVTLCFTMFVSLLQTVST